MTDRELLQMAAKAAGWPVVSYAPAYMCAHGTDHAIIIRNDQGGESVLDPISSDGDAFRLAVKLGLFSGHEVVHYLSLERFAHQDKDDCFAWRRAIVRAAAELGKAMP